MVCERCKSDDVKIEWRDCSVYAVCRRCERVTSLGGDEEGERVGFSSMYDDVEWEAWLTGPAYQGVRRF